MWFLAEIRDVIQDMVKTRDYSPEERARQRAKRYRSLNCIENLPSTREFQQALTIGSTRWIRRRGVESVADLVDRDTGERLHLEVAEWLNLVAGALRQAGFDMSSDTTKGRLRAFLGLGDGPIPRPDHDEFERR